MESITPSVRLQSLVALCLACGFTNKSTSMKISTDVEADWGSEFGQQLWWYMGAEWQEETIRHPMCLYQLYTQVKPLETSRHHCVYVYCTLNRRKASTPCVWVNCTRKRSPRRQANIPWICVNCAPRECLCRTHSFCIPAGLMFSMPHFIPLHDYIDSRVKPFSKDP